MFPEFTTIPVGGHPDVINYTQAFNCSKKEHGNDAIGIIDGDYHLPEEIKSWGNKSIFCIDAHEVENLLCDELLLNAAKTQFLADKNSIETAKQLLFNNLKQDIERQTLEYATQRANNSLKKAMLPRHKDLDSLKSNLKDIYDSMNIDKWADDRKNSIQEAIEEKDYDKCLKLYNNKGIIWDIPKHISKDYAARIFELLKSNDELVDDSKQKHFSHITGPVI